MRVQIGWNAKIEPKMITVTPEWERDANAPKPTRVNSMANLKLKRRSNALSKKSRRELMQAINWLVYSTPWKTVFSKKTKSRYKWKINILTLTLPAQYKEVSVKDFQKLLIQPMLNNLRNNYGLKNYIWKVERTTKGTLHAHITSDTFIHKDDLRRLWNTRLKVNGFTSRFFQEYGHHQPPSTEVASVKHIKNLGGYIAKYLSKTSEQGGLIAGRLWGCNYELSRVRHTRVWLASSNDTDCLNYLTTSGMEKKEIDTKIGIEGKTIWVATCFFPKPRDWIKQALGPLKDAFDDAVFYLRSHYEATPLLAYST